MKLPKTLLAAIVVGITAQAVATSCTKENTTSPKDPVKKEVPKPGNDNCPACGMG